MPGDDLRHIDWNVTARMDAPYVREFLEDRELTAWLLLDTTASMGFGPLARHKGHVLTELATTIAYVLVRGGKVHDVQLRIFEPPLFFEASLLLHLRAVAEPALVALRPPCAWHGPRNSGRAG